MVFSVDNLILVWLRKDRIMIITLFIALNLPQMLKTFMQAKYTHTWATDLLNTAMR